MKRTHLVWPSACCWVWLPPHRPRKARSQAGAGRGHEDARLDIGGDCRRRESIFDVPCPSVPSETELMENQASAIDGLQGAVPNLNIVQGRG